jgi:hypothetical protein
LKSTGHLHPGLQQYYHAAFGMANPQPSWRQI